MVEIVEKKQITIKDITYYFDVKRDDELSGEADEGKGTSGYFAAVTEIKCRRSLLKIPEYFELPEYGRLPIKELVKKAMFCNGSIREVYIFAKLDTVSDWTFSHCKALRKVVFIQAPHFGNGVFEKCPELKNVCILENYSPEMTDEELEKMSEDSFSSLMAEAPGALKADHLISKLDTYGIRSKQWFELWDNALLNFIIEPDDEGYVDLVLCGEEDLDFNPDEYVLHRREKKAELCFLRLMNKLELSDSLRAQFSGYILSQNKGCASEAGWQTLYKNFSDRLEYYKLFAEIGGITEKNIDDLIFDLDENYAEAKAWLLTYKQDNFGGGDIFAEFDL